jgi:hypothetical protein
MKAFSFLRRRSPKALAAFLPILVADKTIILI